MNNERFADAILQVTGVEKEQNGIGTLGEKTLHAVLKKYYEPQRDCQEIKIGRYVADIVGCDGIIEIQTRGFNNLRKKLGLFLDCARVTVVYPIAETKYLSWINEETGEVSKSRRSPKTGTVYDAFYELYKIKQYLDNPNLHIKLVLLKLTEYRYLNGWSANRKKGSERADRVPSEICSEVDINEPHDYAKLIPESLPETFTAKDFSRASRLTPYCTGFAMNVLSHIGAINRVPFSGRAYVYTRTN